MPAAIAELVKIAAQARVLSNPGRPMSETNFRLRDWQVRTRQQTRDDREAEAK